MKVRIHYNGIDGWEDSLVIEADTIEEIREIAFREGDKRNWDKKDCWSEIIEE